MNRVRETARKLGVEESTIRSWILRRRIAFVKIGRSVRVTDDEINRVIRENTIPARAEGR